MKQEYSISASSDIRKLAQVAGLEGQLVSKDLCVGCWWECKLVTATVKNSMEVPQKTKNRITL